MADFRLQITGITEPRKETTTLFFCLEVFSRPQFKEGKPKQRTTILLN